jgi:glycosyltransferase involved in cell wall biosynthesis
MATGCPAVTSNVSSLPEVAGDAALQVDPHSESELASALERLLTSATLRDQLSCAARRRAERFRWENTARASVAFFERL